MDQKIKVFLADDHQVLIDGIKSLLKTNKIFDVVGFSLNGINLIKNVRESEADILVMDINMPMKNGIEVLKELEDLPHKFKVLILSSFDDLKLVREVMKYGAHGYLTKQCAGDNIVEALLEVYTGQEYFCKTIREKICETFTNNFNHSTMLEFHDNIILTERELEILKLITLELNSKEISQALYISTNTVDTHRKNLLKKLNVKTSIGLAKFALKHNLIEG